MGADFLKKQLAKQVHEYSNTVVNCAVSSVLCLAI